MAKSAGTLPSWPCSPQPHVNRSPSTVSITKWSFPGTGRKKKLWRSLQQVLKTEIPQVNPSCPSLWGLLRLIPQHQLCHHLKLQDLHLPDPRNSKQFFWEGGKDTGVPQPPLGPGQAPWLLCSASPGLIREQVLWPHWVTVQATLGRHSTSDWSNINSICESVGAKRSVLWKSERSASTPLYQAWNKPRGRKSS